MDCRDQLQKTLGDAYNLEHEFPGAGMSRVFLAVDTTLNRRVVVNTLSESIASILSTDRVRREIRLAAGLQQASIAPVLTAGEVGALPYSTMPFVEGESLRAHITKSGALPTREAVSILRDITRALDHGVIHRDFKPENVLLSGNTAVVTDFGIAKAIELSHTAPGAGAILTQLGTALGTPAYMFPEQAAADPNVDHRADIYALGVVAYELLAGEPPFAAARSAQAMIAAHITQVPSELSDRCPDAPRALTALVMRCLEKDRALRPQSAASILDALDQSPSSPSPTSAQTPPTASSPTASPTRSSPTSPASAPSTSSPAPR